MVVPTKFMESLSDMVRDIDNWCHFLLTAVMVMLLCFDWQRKHKYQLLKMPGLTLFWIIGFVLTAIFEILQISFQMNIGAGLTSWTFCGRP